MMKNYRGEQSKDSRIRIFLGTEEEKCIKELARVWRKRDGSEMRYTDIVRLALFNLASQSDIDVLPYLGLISTALKDVQSNFDELNRLKRVYADRILTDPELQNLCDALESAQNVLSVCEDEMMRELVSGALLRPADSPANEQEG